MMLKGLLFAALVIASANAQKCISLSGKITGYCAASVSSKACLTSGMTEADYKAIADASLSIMSTVMNKDLCVSTATSTCIALGTTMKAGACDNGANFCSLYVSSTLTPDCDKDTDCTAAGTSVSTYKSKPICCSAITSSLSMCTSVDKALQDAMVASYKTSKMCDDTNCITPGSAASLAISVILPLVAAATTLMATYF